MSAPEKQTGVKRRVGDGTPGPGRKKGVPNKTTIAVKEALSLAFEGVGGVIALQEWANDNRTEFYRIWAKLLPTEIKADVPGGITVVVQSKDERL